MPFKKSIMAGVFMSAALLSSPADGKNLDQITHLNTEYANRVNEVKEQNTAIQIRLDSVMTGMLADTDGKDLRLHDTIKAMQAGFNESFKAMTRSEAPLVKVQERAHYLQADAIEALGKILDTHQDLFFPMHRFALSGIAHQNHVAGMGIFTINKEFFREASSATPAYSSPPSSRRL